MFPPLVSKNLEWKNNEQSKKLENFKNPKLLNFADKEIKRRLQRNLCSLQKHDSK
jgi:hypothetical protein